jgi:hypothetical protein
MTRPGAIAVGIGVVVLAACSSAPPAGVYVKAGVTEAERQRDQAECVATAAASDNSRSLGLTSAEREVIDACMRDRGYSRTAGR